MKFIIAFIFLFSLLLIDQPVEPGMACPLSTFAISLIIDVAEYESISVEQVLDKLCSYLPSEMSLVCEEYINKYAELLIEELKTDDHPDSLARKIGLCPMDSQCTLFPSDKKMNFKKNSKSRYSNKDTKVSQNSKSVWESILDELKKIYEKHDPIVDLDGDHFSDTRKLRGSNWRGKDCDDLNRSTFPGKVPNSGDKFFDSNCNGIHGRDENKINYEDKFCKGTQPMTTMVIGDSIGAHFHIPVQFLQADQLSNGVLKDNLIELLEMEGDWPQKSWATGFDLTPNDMCEGDVNSIYLKMLERNQCNHRNYVNIAVNGMSSAGVYDLLKSSLIESIQKESYPVFGILQLFGDDICIADNITQLPTPQQFRENMVKALHKLDSLVAPGSVFFLMSLLDGTRPYNVLHDKIHPIGHGVTYADFYEYMKCTQISFCSLFLTTNITEMLYAEKLALKYTQQLKDITETEKFVNFDAKFLETPQKELDELFIANGWDLTLIYEPVGGFHPTQLSNYWMAELIWKRIVTLYPEFVPPINPHNKEIIQKFGDQGGY
ncbi:acyloxyacyl hydrolase [Anaeramoeba flamelloides]|uniref:Acyloxyacyl hydrolase n=1 Tax=Anaeramoeba flamelloides TaxID=1746091 RepID=A0AAV7YDE4_9EUKA|nr:acyloxyacyl hydrolase [Anaeramoeba flamelloides]